MRRKRETVIKISLLGKLYQKLTLLILRISTEPPAYRARSKLWISPMLLLAQQNDNQGDQGKK